MTHSDTKTAPVIPLGSLWEFLLNKYWSKPSVPWLENLLMLNSGPDIPSITCQQLGEKATERSQSIDPNISGDVSILGCFALYVPDLPMKPT